MLHPYPNIGIILILALSASVILSDKEANKQRVSADIDKVVLLHDPQNVLVGFSSWASIGYVNDVSPNRERSHVVIDFFPFQFCQAVRLCITKSQSFTKEILFMIKGDYCDEYINYYPPTGAIEAKIEGKTTKGYISLFKLTASTGVRVLKYSKEPYWRNETYKEKSELEVQLRDKMFLILTNSRQCHSRIRVDGHLSNLNVIQTKDVDAATNLPEVFNYDTIDKKSKTLYTGTGMNTKRSSDLLHQLKAKKNTKSQIGHKLFKCEYTGVGTQKRSIITKTSVIQVTKQIDTGSGDGHSKKFSIDLSDCHWLRLWFAAPSTEWNKYETDFKPEHSIDIFFKEGFILLPDRETSVPLSLSVDAVRTISIKVHGTDLIELLLGAAEYPVPIVFNSEIMKNNDATIFLIRSPYCDASFRAPAADQMLEPTKINKLKFKTCKAYSIEGPPAQTP